MLYFILHDTCIHHSNVCDIDNKSCTLLFIVYMQCHYIAFLLILLEYYTSSYILKGYILQELGHDTCYKAINTTQ